MKLLFNIENQHITQLNDRVIAAESMNYLTARFFFSEDWDGAEKTAVFEGDTPYCAVLKNDECIVPHEVIAEGQFKVSVYCFRDDMRITTDRAYVTVVKTGCREGETPKPPTPTVYEQLLGRISEADNAVSVEAQQRAGVDSEILRQLADETKERKAAVESEEAARCSDVNELNQKINSLSEKADEFAGDYVSKSGIYQTSNGQTDVLWQKIVDETAKAEDKVGYTDAVNDTNGRPTGYLAGEILCEVGGFLKSHLFEAVLDLLGDFEILPAADGITEQIVIKRAWAADKYCVYAGDTPFTAESISVTEPTVTAKGGFEGSNITVRLYAADGVQISTVKLNVIEISGRKIGRMERI
ncbi:MAG: hypothetical protein PUF72_09940 [Clostridiales bacterium]|nr:hypothetical protein [Clostridiales bacterium]